MNLNNERISILRSINYGYLPDLIYDPSLPLIIKQLFSELEAADTDGKKRLVRRLIDLYDGHGPPLIRCIFENAFLLHTDYDINDIFNQIFSKLGSDLKENSHLSFIFVNELYYFSNSPYDTVRSLISLVLEQLAPIEGQLGQIVNNKNSSFLLRHKASRAIVENEIVNEYGSLLKLLNEILEGGSKNEFNTKALPLLKVYKNTQNAGLNLAIEAYLNGKLNKHGPLIISSFGDVFHDWFRSQDIDPSVSWAKVLLKAWKKSSEFSKREFLLSLLINEWSKYQKVARYLKKAITDMLFENPHYLSVCSENLGNDVRNFIGDKQLDFNSFKAQIAQYAEKESHLWEEYISSISLNRATGWVFALSCAESPEHTKDRILSIIPNVLNPRFLSGFYEKIASIPYFKLLDPTFQLRVLKLDNIAFHVTLEMVDSILSALEPIDRNVEAELKAIYAKLNKGLSSNDINGPYGKLE